MSTVLEQARAGLLAAMLRYRDGLIAELAAADRAIEVLGAEPPTAKKTAKRPTRKAAGAKPEKARAKVAKKKAEKPAARKVGKLAAPKAIHEPVARIGRVSSKVLVKAIEDEPERKRFVDELIAQGYRRAKTMERLAPGIFDVNVRDGAVTVQWWPFDKVEAA